MLVSLLLLEGGGGWNFSPSMSMLEHLLTLLFSLYYFGYLNLYMPICQQEPPRRKASEMNGDLSECAKKGIAGEPLVKLSLLLCIHNVAFSIS